MALNIDGAHAYRVGRTLGTTLYAQWTDDPSKKDTYLAIFDSREWAAGVAHALNGDWSEDRRLVAIDRLLYPQERVSSSEPLALGDFVGVAVSAEMAAHLSGRVLYQPMARMMDEYGG